ncbi:MAG: Nif3-like dinuclear metal center hexameric protein, partial [SAR86 cluster bacterium]
MSVSLQEVQAQLKQLLRPEQFKDYCPNGLQVQGKSQIDVIVSGVTASQALIEKAILLKADLLLVHHGYFWKGEDQAITGIKKRRVTALLEHQINLLAYHLPLDAHATLGNNAKLGELLGFTVTGDMGKQNNHPIGLLGTTDKAYSSAEFAQLLAQKLNREPLVIEAGERPIKRVAWCTGAAQNYIQLAVDAGVDAYITGEISEPTVHIARETGVHFFAAGHHATERYGVQALGE